MARDPTTGLPLVSHCQCVEPSFLSGQGDLVNAHLGSASTQNVEDSETRSLAIAKGQRQESFKNPVHLEPLKN